jgi:hypothetical protein
VCYAGVIPNYITITIRKTVGYSPFNQKYRTFEKGLVRLSGGFKIYGV